MPRSTFCELRPMSISDTAWRAGQSSTSAAGTDSTASRPPDAVLPVSLPPIISHGRTNVGAAATLFELARSHLAPSVEVMDIDIADLTPERVGRFDIALFAGVLYHLRHPLITLEQIARLADMLIVETWLDARDQERPMMVFYPGSELANDHTNWWGPNRACVEAMLRDVGFPGVAFTPHPVYPERGIFHAYHSTITSPAAPAAPPGVA